MNRTIRLLPSVLGTLTSLVGAIAPVPARAQQTTSTPAFTIIDVPFPGAHDTIADRINQNGVIVGNYLDASGGEHGFLAQPPYNAGDFGLIDVNVAQFPGAHDTAAEGINDLGQIVGSFLDSSDLTVGFLLDSDGVTFHKLDFGFGLVDASGINNFGDIVGTVFHLGAFHGFLLGRTAGNPILIDVPGQTHTEASAITDRGEIVGLYEDATGGQHGFLASPPYSAADFRVIDADVAFRGAHDTQAYDMNFHSQMVGRYRDTGGSRHGFLVTPPFSARDFSQIDTKVKGGHDTVAIGINDSGQVVGRYTDATGNHGFLRCADTDGDGLCDDWEKNGLFVNVNGTPVFLDLPRMGADPNHKDIFVQADHMEVPPGCLGTSPPVCFGHTHQPTLEAIASVIQAFADAPVENPDGTTGIRLHVDCGPLCVMNPVTGGLWFGLSQAKTLAEVTTLGSTDPVTNTYDWTAFQAIKDANFPAERAPAFHYVVWAHYGKCNPKTAAEGCPSGVSRAEGVQERSSDFIVSLGDFTNHVGTPMEQAGSFMHELGHNLGLDHGGDLELPNNKPNYLSVMNYLFQTSGLIKDCTAPLPVNCAVFVDYSRFGPDVLPSLDESLLNETVGLNGGSTLAGYGTTHFCPGTDFHSGQAKQEPDANGPIDWNCNGDASEMVPAEINGDIPPSLDVLTSFDDWSHLIYTGGAIGGNGVAVGLPMQTAAQQELTPEMDSHLPKLLSVAVTGSGGLGTAPGTNAVVRFTVVNRGLVDDTYAISTASDVTWADFSGVPPFLSVSAGASKQVTIPVKVPASATAGTMGHVSLKAVSGARSLVADSDQVVLVVVGVQGDTIPPVTTAVLSPLPNAAGWNNSNVTIALNSTDNETGGTGVKQITYSATGAQSVASTVVNGASASFTISAEGVTTISYFGIDNAGNVESTKTVTIQLDKTRPTITPVRTPPPNANGWNNTNVTVSFQCSDGLSGLATGSPPAPTTLSTEGAGQSVTGTCTDVAGNSASATVTGINIDKTPPTVACGAGPNVLWPPNNKLVPVNVSVTVTDALSGPAGFTLALVASSEPDSGLGDIQGFVTGTASTSGQLRAQRLGTGTGRIYTFTYSGADRAGNTASCTTTVTVPHDQGQN